MILVFAPFTSTTWPFPLFSKSHFCAVIDPLLIVAITQIESSIGQIMKKALASGRREPRGVCAARSRSMSARMTNHRVLTGHCVCLLIVGDKRKRRRGGGWGRRRGVASFSRRSNCRPRGITCPRVEFVSFCTARVLSKEDLFVPLSYLDETMM